MKTNLCTGCNNQWRSELSPKYCPECGDKEHISRAKPDEAEDPVMDNLNKIVAGVNELAQKVIGKDVVDLSEKWPHTVRFYYEIYMDLMVNNFEEMENIAKTQKASFDQKGYTVSKAGTTELEE
jgi:hypothetical protein